MKKKLIHIALALMCVIACTFSFGACNNGSSATINSLYATDGVNNEYTGDKYCFIEINYGDALDLTKYKLFLDYSNGDTKEVLRTDEKLSVKYYYIDPWGLETNEDDKQEITALPDDMISGTYMIEYVYDGNIEIELKTAVYVLVSRAESGNFTVQPVGGTIWQSQGAVHNVIVKNPKGEVVQQQEEVVLDGYVSYLKPKPNDTDGCYSLYLFEKSVYDSYTEAQKKDYDFLYQCFLDDGQNGNERRIHSYDPEDENYEVVDVPAGEYMLLALVEETYNYLKIATPAVQITVTAPSENN